MVGVDGAAQGDGHLLAAGEACHELLGNADKYALVNLAAGLLGVEAFGLDAELLLGIFLVAQDKVAAFHQGGHHLGGRLAVFPEFLAVVEVAGDLHAHFVGNLDGLQAGVGGTLAERAGVMPVQWNQSAPSKTLFQSTMPGLISETAECARS